jgi:hypothetical protein
VGQVPVREPLERLRVLEFQQQERRHPANLGHQVLS